MQSKSTIKIVETATGGVLFKKKMCLKISQNSLALFFNKVASPRLEHLPTTVSVE